MDTTFKANPAAAEGLLRMFMDDVTPEPSRKNPYPSRELEPKRDKDMTPESLHAAYLYNRLLNHPSFNEEQTHTLLVMLTFLHGDHTAFDPNFDPTAPDTDSSDSEETV